MQPERGGHVTCLRPLLSLLRGRAAARERAIKIESEKREAGHKLGKSVGMKEEGSEKEREKEGNR